MTYLYIITDVLVMMDCRKVGDSRVDRCCAFFIKWHHDVLLYLCFSVLHCVDVQVGSVFPHSLTSANGVVHRLSAIQSSSVCIVYIMPAEPRNGNTRIVKAECIRNLDCCISGLSTTYVIVLLAFDIPVFIHHLHWLQL